MVNIEVKKGSIVSLRVNAIVNPANSFGYMGGGVAMAIKQVGGQQIEDEALEQAPIQVGTAILTAAGDLPCEKIIHSPTMHDPGSRTNAYNVECAVNAALEIADEQGYSTIAMPGMGTGIGGLSKKDAAKAMVKAIKQFKAKSLDTVILTDIDDEMVEEFKKAAK